MKAVRCNHGKVHLVEVERPKGEGVRVKVVSVGICGSDLHLLTSDVPVQSILGHEITGITGNGIPVAIEPIVPCGHCAYCVEGQYNHCDLGGFATTMGVGRDGGMTEEMIVPERCLVPLPSGLDIADAFLVEPLAVAIHGIIRAGVRSGDQVAIIGGGSIGLCAVAAARDITPHVALVARHDAQKSAGERLGARLNVWGSYDVVVDCAGTAAALAEAVGLCRPAGSLLLLANYWEGLTLPAFDLTSKEIRVVSANRYARHGGVRDVDLAASLLARNPAIAQSIITHRMPLNSAVEAFAVAANRSGGAIKVALEP
ncbi:MAG: Zn-dependent alcohol dehydrogenase [Rhodospirillales bacterium]|nr:Zn-dependent alcohol dehydrogenase [Rhodospirillales bacterium]